MEATTIQSAEQTKAQPLEQIKNNLPLISICLLILSTLNLMIYYDFYGVDILSYIDFTEVLQLQFRFFVKSIAIVIAVILYLVLAGRSPKSILEEDRIKAERLEMLKKAEEVKGEVPDTVKTIEEEKAPLLSKKIFLVTLVTLLPLLSFSWFFLTSKRQEGIFMLLLLSIPVIDILIMIAYYRMRDGELVGMSQESARKRSFTTLTTLAFVIPLVYTICIITRLSAISDLDGSSNSEVTINLKDKAISTNNDYRYIGKTKSFTFFYSRSKQQAEIFQNSEITNMTIRNGIDYPKAIDKKFLIEISELKGIQNWAEKFD